MSDEAHEYYSFLLRLWQTRSGGNVVWRASLESAQTGERCGFAYMASLFAFLEEQTDGGASQDDRTPTTRR
jgi:hypothetical protein